MGLETATYISQLNELWPTSGDPVSEGDNHIRLIKQVLQDQFPGLGAAAVTVTAAQLNAVVNKVSSFNGRNGAVLPAEGDYDLGEMGDVTLTSPAISQVLMYSGSEWVNIRGGAVLTAGRFLYDSYAGAVGSSVYFTNARSNDVAASVATIKNDGTGGIGWMLTAVSACYVQLNFMLSVSSGTTGIAVAYDSGTPSSSFPSLSGNRLAYVNSLENESQSASVSMKLAAGESICLYRSATGTTNNETVNGVVIQL